MYMIYSVSLVVHLIAAKVDAMCQLETERDCFGTIPRILVSTCKAFGFWNCILTVSGTGGSAPGMPSGMPGYCY